jgi:hypothetical protein
LLLSRAQGLAEEEKHQAFIEETMRKILNFVSAAVNYTKKQRLENVREDVKQSLIHFNDQEFSDIDILEEEKAKILRKIDLYYEILRRFEDKVLKVPESGNATSLARDLQAIANNQQSSNKLFLYFINKNFQSIRRVQKQDSYKFGL